MNVVKKVIALITVVLIVIRFAVISVSASFAAGGMVAAEEMTALLETALVGSGLYTESELEGKSYYELNDLLKDGINNGQIDPKKEIIFYKTPTEKIKFSIMEAMTDPEIQAEIGVKNAYISEISDNSISYWLNYQIENGGDLYDFIHPTYVTPGFQGETSKIYDYWAGIDSSYYAIYYSSKPGELYYDYYGDLHYRIYYDYYESYSPNGVERIEQSGYRTATVTDLCPYYGKWILEDTEINVGTEELPVIGEADGTQVTPDMLNPDGTVTIDGTTYYPKDFIDWDKFKDPAIIDLLNKILSKLEEAPVVSEQDKPLVDVDSIEIAVPEELSDYTVPVGIANVFPFCLPWDFARGVKMLLAKPEVPVFKTEFDLTDFCGFDLGVIPLEISLEKWEPAVVIIRWFFLFLFIVSLIKISPKIVKGAG